MIYNFKTGPIEINIGDELEFLRDHWENMWGTEDPCENEIADSYASEKLVVTNIDSTGSLEINGGGCHNPYYFRAKPKINIFR